MILTMIEPFHTDALFACWYLDPGTLVDPQTVQHGMYGWFTAAFSWRI